MAIRTELMDELIARRKEAMAGGGEDKMEKRRKKGQDKKKFTIKEFAATRTVLEIYELDDYIINGLSQPLPVGGRIINPPVPKKSFWDFKL